MLIDGIKIQPGRGLPELVEDIKGLPPSVPGYNRLHPSCSCLPASHIENEYKQGKASVQAGSLDSAISWYRGVLVQVKEEKYQYFSGMVHASLAEALIARAEQPTQTDGLARPYGIDPVNAMRREALFHQEKAADAIAETEQARSFKPLFDDWARNARIVDGANQENKYKALLADVETKRGTPGYKRKEEIVARRFLASYAECQIPPDITVARQHREVLYNLEQGPVREDARAIDERGVGFSADQPLGTTNIQQCTVVIVFDPLTKKTALAHFNRATNPQSLETEVLSKFDPHHALGVHIIGSREEMGSSTSQDNLEQVMSILKSHANVNVLSSSIWGANNPTAIVVDPKTGKIENAVPAILPKQTLLQTGIRYITPAIGRNLPLVQSCDLTEGKAEVEQLYLSASNMTGLSSYIGKTANDIYMDAAKSYNQSLQWSASAVKGVVALVEENAFQAEAMLNSAQAKAAMLGMPPLDEAANRQYYLQSPKHIGNNAQELNRNAVEQQISAKATELENTRLCTLIHNALATEQKTIDPVLLLKAVAALPKFEGVNNPRNDSIVGLVQKALYVTGVTIEDLEIGGATQAINALQGPKVCGINKEAMLRIKMDENSGAMVLSEHPSAKFAGGLGDIVKSNMDIIKGLALGGVSQAVDAVSIAGPIASSGKGMDIVNGLALGGVSQAVDAADIAGPMASLGKSVPVVGQKIIKR